jgi:3'(2'), 5'-bisphosphate nucleotidase
MALVKQRIINSLLDNVERLKEKKARLVTEPQVDVAKLISVCIDLAEKSGEIIRKIWWSGELGAIEKGGGVEIDGKQAEDPQTVADRKSEELIISTLQMYFKGINIVGEESSETGDLEFSSASAIYPKMDLVATTTFGSIAASRVTVWVDPLDGTAEFYHGNIGAVTSLIGVAIDGVPAAGIIHQPFYSKGVPWWGSDNIATAASEAAEHPCGRTIWGSTGGTGVHGLETGARGGEYIVSTSRNKRHSRTDPALEAIAPIVKGREVQELRVGAAGHHLLCVLEGHADLYLQFCAGCKRWDTCAGEALLRACGGLLTDAAGEVYNYDSAQHPLVSR